MDWENIYRGHAQAIFHYLLNLSGNQAASEDLLQETFIKAMRSEDSLKDPNKIHSWLMTIARNQFLDVCKKNNRRKTSVIGDFEEEGFRFESQEDSPEDIAVKNDFNSRLYRAMTGLSENYRTAFTLGVVQKLPYNEISDITGWSLAMVKSNIFRARKKIAGKLSEFQG